MSELLGTTREAFDARIAELGYSRVHSSRLWKYLYREAQLDCCEMLELPPRLRARLAEEFAATPIFATRETHSSDGFTTKYLVELADGRHVETVVMRYQGRATVCVSSQAGCAIGCVFCATGQMGFGRNLTTGEILAQVLFAAATLQQSRTAEQGANPLRNVVLMGMGEPLLNYEAVIRALQILSDNAGLSLAQKRLTLSTVGVVPAIRRLADERQPYSLAVSLHAATQEERIRLVPAARAWPLQELMEACRDYTMKLGRKIFFEWTLIDRVNDHPADAQSLGELLAGMPAHVNLIPLNPIVGFAGEASQLDRAREFQAVLHARGIPSTLRQKRGIDIAAGCGQLTVSAASNEVT